LLLPKPTSFNVACFWIHVRLFQLFVTCQFSYNFALAAFVGNNLGGAATVASTADPETHYAQVSIPDEDPQDAIVTDPDVLAEVKLPNKPSWFSTTQAVIWLLIANTRISVDFRQSCRAAQPSFLPNYGPAIPIRSTIS
jgi:hypothetical protein